MVLLQAFSSSRVEDLEYAINVGKCLEVLRMHSAVAFVQVCAVAAALAVLSQRIAAVVLLPARTSLEGCTPV